MDKMFLAEFIDGGPGCGRDDCNIIDNGPSVSTFVNKSPMFDKQGINTNPNVNLTTTPRRCLSCGKTWTEHWQDGQRV